MSGKKNFMFGVSMCFFSIVAMCVDSGKMIYCCGDFVFVIFPSKITGWMFFID
jgi:hypothetical protein